MTSKLFTNIAYSVTFSIVQLFSFIVLGNKDGDMSSFKFLFCLYVTLTVFSGNCVIKLHEAKKLLFFLGLLASSLEMFLTSEDCFLTLLSLSLATKYF